MSRNGAGIYTLPAGSVIANGDTSDAADLNVPLADLEADMNTPRPIVAGGTGADNAADARTNLGAQAADADLTAIAGLSSSGLIARTGAGTAAARTITAGGGITVTDGDGVSGNPTIAATIAQGTSVASTSGTSIDFTGIPSWVRRITIFFNAVSTNGTSLWLLQLGDSGGIEATGYSSRAMLIDNSGNSGSSATTGFLIGSAGAATVIQTGVMVLSKFDSGNTWIVAGQFNRVDAATATAITTGSKELSAALDRVRITTASGTDTFDAGSVNISWE